MIFREYNNAACTAATRTVRLIASTLITTIASLYIGNKLTRNHARIDHDRSSSTCTSSTIARLLSHAVFPRGRIGNR
jgi:hypothetical protein